MWGNFVINQVFITFVTCWLSRVIPILLNLFLLSLLLNVSFFMWQWIVLSADFDHQRPDLFSSRHGGNIWTRSRRPALQVFWNSDSPALTIKSKIGWPKHPMLFIETMSMRPALGQLIRNGWVDQCGNACFRPWLRYCNLGLWLLGLFCLGLRRKEFNWQITPIMD